MSTSEAPLTPALLQLFRDDFAQISERLEARGVELLEAPSAAAVPEIFRDLHTLKGNSQAVGLGEMGALAHALEEVLDGLRARGEAAGAELGSVLLEANDAFREMVSGGGTEIPRGLLERVAALSGDGHTPALPATGPPTAPGAGAPGEGETRGEVLTIPVEAERISAVFEAAERLRARLLATDDPRLAGAAEEVTRQLLALGRVPVARIVPRLRRAVIETARAVEREVAMEVRGEEAQADAALVQDLGAVLPHMLRNAIDHGIEDPGERSRHGKPAAGRLSLEFAVTADALRVAVEDDGRGMDSEAIVASAVARGLLTSAEAGRLGEEERLRLIFAPGLSTRGGSDAISGRGVGMDAVAAVAEKHRGSISVRTRVGRGSRIEMRFPLRLRWEEFVVAEVDGWVIGVPVRQVASLHADGLPADLVELPVARLGDFGSPPVERAAAALHLRAGAGEMILPVDSLRGFAGALVQPAPGRLLPSCVSGLAQLSDGTILWTLDADALTGEAEGAPGGG